MQAMRPHRTRKFVRVAGRGHYIRGVCMPRTTGFRTEGQATRGRAPPVRRDAAYRAFTARTCAGTCVDRRSDAAVDEIPLSEAHADTIPIRARRRAARLRQCTHPACDRGSLYRCLRLSCGTRSANNPRPEARETRQSTKPSFSHGAASWRSERGRPCARRSSRAPPRSRPGSRTPRSATQRARSKPRTSWAWAVRRCL